MKKTSCFLLLASCFILAACGSDDSNSSNGGHNQTTASADDVPEGTGPTLDVSSTSNSESVIKSILNSVDGSFDSSGSGNSSSTGSTSSSSSNMVKLLAKATGTNDETYQFCSKGSYVETINKTIKGYSGTATFEGSINTAKTSDDQATATTDINGTFINFVYYPPAKGKNYKLTGTANMGGEAHVTKGMKQLCDAALSGATLYDNNDMAMDTTSHQSGELSISGDIGAALAFDITATMSASFDSTTTSSDISILGIAELKSGGKTVTCVIGKEGDLEDTDITVDCE